LGVESKERRPFKDIWEPLVRKRSNQDSSKTGQKTQKLADRKGRSTEPRVRGKTLRRRNRTGHRDGPRTKEGRNTMRGVASH